ncbi:hypothetical protein [Streptomyces fradiae]|uniref:hypothetical protein n=1 Tax=Streptomyces fradiae TaxID=1906 RepID=UPI002941C74C|nr:hypothetical protein [Streptomyces fradiae]WOI60890.1 hypothetical protein RYQ63_13830 [Streptomyces fradiae]
MILVHAGLGRVQDREVVLPSPTSNEVLPVLLQLEHLEEPACLFDQLVVRAHLGDAALVENDDPVGEAGVGQPVGDEDRARPSARALSRV